MRAAEPKGAEGACGKKRKTAARADGQPLRGLPPAKRFAQILDDLDAIRRAWGGDIPEGLRNTWLHLVVTALTHTVDPADIRDRALAIAAVGVPDLPPNEIEATIRSGVSRAARVAGAYAGPASDPRLSYAGHEIAERLGVDAAMATALDLRQIIPAALRHARRNARRRASRQKSGRLSREEYLAQNRASLEAPWVAAGMSRATWYRRQRAAAVAIADAGETATASETGPVPQQGGLGPAERPAEIADRSHGPHSDPQPTPTGQPRRRTTTAAATTNAATARSRTARNGRVGASRDAPLHAMQDDALRSGIAEDAVG